MLKLIFNNKSITIIGVLLLLFLTFFRENLALEINACLNNSPPDNRAFNYWFIDFIKGLTKPELIKWKWGITIFVTILMSVISVISIERWFLNSQFLKLTLLIYLCLFSLVLLMALVGYLTSSFNEIYLLVRKILGIIQSPIPFFALFSLFYYKDNRS